MKTLNVSNGIREELPNRVRTLLHTEQALRRERSALSVPELDLLQELGHCLQNLCDWIAVSHPAITLEVLRNNAEELCAQYCSEVECWAADNNERMHRLLARSKAWMAEHLSEIQRQRITPDLGNDWLIGARFVPALSEDDAYEQSRLFKALADPTRLRILSLLSCHGGLAYVSEMVEAFPLEQPTISHHLRILRDAGLVDSRKRGTCAYYYVKQDALGRARSIIEQFFSH
jgi:ArsR family transcriptional regulator